MSTKRIVKRPLGKALPVYYSNAEERVGSAVQLIDNWQEYCEQNWISRNHEDPFCAENRVKVFLDDVAYLYLLDNSEGTMSEHKVKHRADHEMPISSCPDQYKMMFYGEDAAENRDNDAHLPPTEEKEKQATGKRKELSVSIRARRIDQIHEQLPGGAFTFVPIDTENVFIHDGKKYRLDLGVAEYQPKMYRGEMMYCMDTVVVVNHEGTLHFFNQDYLPLDRQLVYDLTD